MQTNIEKNVMRRVHTIHILRPVFSGFTVCTLVLVVCIFAISREVWVARVLENMPHTNNVTDFSRFWLVAFDNTRLTVQALSLLTIAALAYLARETSRLVSSALTFARI